MTELQKKIQELKNLRIQEILDSSKSLTDKMLELEADKLYSESLKHFYLNDILPADWIESNKNDYDIMCEMYESMLSAGEYTGTFYLFVNIADSLKFSLEDSLDAGLIELTNSIDDLFALLEAGCYKISTENKISGFWYNY
jgi:hypothetical protein